MEDPREIEQDQAGDSGPEAIKADGTTAEDFSPPRGEPFPIVGVGSSAGGLDAVTQLLRALPAKTGMAFVLVQHLDPHHKSELAGILTAETTMPIHIAEEGMPIRPDEVYIIPPNAIMTIEDGKLRIAPRKPGLSLPIDAFFESLARAQGSRAIGVVLSGNASDGSQGVRAIKGECGVTFAQDEASATHSGMPRNAVATGAVDYVLPPAEIARELVHLSNHPFLIPPATQDSGEEVLPEGRNGELKKVLSLLRNGTKVDFTHYKQTTIRRRIGRRMMVCRSKDLAEYALYLQKHPEEIRELYGDLLINVTSFFRDPEVFAVLGRLLRDILPNRNTGEPFRVWTAGCATGEELYSLAICLREILEQLDLHTPLQLFGTDISDFALGRARSGAYPENIAQDVSQERLNRYFTRSESGYRVAKSIRESCIFARQNVAKDPPFAHMDLISCRNLLIYMDASLQKQVLPVFHYSLNFDGLLVLGSAETIAAAGDLFTVADKQARIYRRKVAPSRLTLSLDFSRNLPDPTTVLKDSAALTVTEIQKKVDRLIQAKYSPPAAVVDAELQILQFRGHTSPYLDPAPGEASLNLLHMAREGLVVPLRRTIKAAAERNTTVRETDLPIDYGDHRQKINLEVTPIAGAKPGERYYLVVFEEPVTAFTGTSAAGPLPETKDPGDYGRALEIQIQEHKRELAELREYLQNLREDHEAHSEELRAANEELGSANEELQSTNEELSTTKEELQSANEELRTLNEELQHRNQEVSTVNNDLTNLLSAVEVPFLIVDNNLRIRRFSVAAGRLFALEALDVGNPVMLLDRRIEVPGIQQLIHNVIQTLRVEQKEVQDKAGHWFSMAVRPYRTIDNRIDGAVIVFADIDPLKRNLQAAEGARDYAEGMIETVREPLMVLDGDLRIQRATQAFYETFQVSREETIGRFIYDLGNGQWNRPRLRELLGGVLFRNTPFQDCEIEHNFPHIGQRTMRLNARQIPQREGHGPTALLAIEDVTKRSEEAEVRYQRLFESAKDGVLVIDAETQRITDVNPFFMELSGYRREEMIGKTARELPRFLEDGLAARIIAECFENELVRYEDVTMLSRDGQRIEAELVANKYHVGTQQVVQINVRDVTARNRITRALRESEERFRLFVESVRDYALFQTDETGIITTWNNGAERLLGYTESEIVGQPVALVFTPEDIAKGAVQKEMHTAGIRGWAEDERWHVRKNGTRFFSSGVLSPIHEESGRLRGYAKIMRDVTGRKETEERLRSSLAEKELLLKEIHHRVKNNLQVIASLISLQSEFVRESGTISIMKAIQTRVRSIASIHEMLYGSGDLLHVDFSAYLKNLAGQLFSFYSTDADHVHLEIDSGSNVLDIREAVPCGLIVNELLTNSLKHAFPGNRTGWIRISFECSDNHCKLKVADNGIGLPPDFDVRTAGSLGLQLITLLVEQLRGTLTTEKIGDGVHFTVLFDRKSD